MAVNLSPVGGVAAQFFNNSGSAPLTGGKLYSYAAGTTTPAATYTSSNGATAWTNPIVLDSAGRVPSGGEIWLTDGINYKFILKDANDVTIATYDNISGINSNYIAFTNSQEIQTATAGQTVFTLTTMQYQPGTNSLSVFVDGVNQYGPGAQYAYLETDATTVTFISGLHVGAEVKFTTTQQQGAGAVDASQVSYTPPFTGSVATNVEVKLSEYVSVKDFGAVGDGTTDDTAAIQAAIDSGAKRVICPAPGQYYLNGSGLTIDVSNFEFVIEGGAALVKENSGKTIHVASTAISISNIKITGGGKIIPSAVPHSVASSGILVGSSGSTIDNLVIDVDIINMGQYAIASGATDVVLTNFTITDGHQFSVDPTGAWHSGASVAQTVDLNLTVTQSTGKIGASNFKIVDTGSALTDCFKWNKWRGTIVGATFDGGTVTVVTFGAPENFVFSGAKVTKNSAGGSGLVIGNSTNGGMISGIDARTATTSIPMLYFSGAMSGINVEGFKTNGTISATAPTTMSGCNLRGITLTTTDNNIDLNTLTSFSGGVIDGVDCQGSLIIKGNNNRVRNVDLTLTGAYDGITITGDDNWVINVGARNSTGRVVRLAGNRNLADGIVCSYMSNTVRIDSGTANQVGHITKINSASGDIEDAGTSSVIPFKAVTGLTGSTTVSAPHNPTSRTTFKFSALAGATTLTNITGATVGDEVTLVNEDAANTVTMTRSNAVLAGGANCVLGQYDTLRMVFNDSLWHEISRSANS